MTDPHCASVIPSASRTTTIGPYRLLPFLSTAVALAISGCAPPAPPAPTTQQQVTRKVSDFTAGMDSAIDQADPARLRAASEGRPLPPPAKPSLAGAAPATPSADPITKPLRKPSIPSITTTPMASLSTDHSMPGVPSLLGTVTPPPAPAPPPGSLVPSTPTTAPDASLVSAVLTSPTSQPAATAPTTMSSVVTIEPATQPAVVTIVPPKSFVPPLPPAPPAEATVDAALAVLQKQAAEHPSLNTTLALALLTTAQGKAPDPTAAASLAPNDQKLLTDLLAAFQNMTAPAAPGITLADRAAPLVEAAKKWQVAADLILPKLALASRVDSFGVYTPVDAKFPAGARHTVIIYCEVANFTSKRDADGWYETHLSQQDTLITDDGLLIWRPTAEEVEDRSMNQRRDFYLVKKLTIPDNLAAGKYTLRMSVTDKNSGKIATTNIPVDITDK